MRMGRAPPVRPRPGPGPGPVEGNRRRLWAEILILFLGVPVALAAFFGSYPLLPTLLALALLALTLLAVTPGFRLRELLRWPRPAPWRLILGFWAVSAALTLTLVLWLVPDRLLWLPRQRPGFWLLIVAFYPVVSALPQELIFRVLFFRRYRALFRDERTAIIANAAAFGLAHLFYQNWIAVALPTLAGLVLGWAYRRHGSALLVVLLHALAGQLIFTLGLGAYFFHGAIGQLP